jgi:hypothetical protein
MKRLDASGEGRNMGNRRSKAAAASIGMAILVGALAAPARHVTAVDALVDSTGASPSAETFETSSPGAARQAPDCNGNGVPDDLDILLFACHDLNDNQIPDDCEPDCNGNGLPDSLDLESSGSLDCNGDDIPDDCQGAALLAGQNPEWLEPEDSCENAVAVCPGTIFDLEYQTDGGTAWSTCATAAPQQRHLWFTYQPEWNGPVLINTCGSTVATSISVHTGCPATADNAMACSEDSCVLIFQADGGTEYMIRIGGDQTGAMQIALDGPTCATATSFVLDAIIYEPYGPGPAITGVTQSLGINRLPMVYGHDIDRDLDGLFEDEDRQFLTIWIDETLPEDYRGPACLDYEQPYGVELRAPVIDPARLQEIIDVYTEILFFARDQRPEAQWGFWGMPMIRHTDPAWQAQGNSIVPLLEASGAIYPSIYDCFPSSDNGPVYATYVQWTLDNVAGEVPVYPFFWSRFCGSANGSGTLAIPPDEFFGNVNDVLDTAHVTTSGQVHRPAGIVLWDLYSLLPGEWTWLGLDQYHACLLHELDELAQEKLTAAE